MGMNLDDLFVFNCADDIQVDRHFITIQVIAKKYSGEVNEKN